MWKGNLAASEHACIEREGAWAKKSNRNANYNHIDDYKFAVKQIECRQCKREKSEAKAAQHHQDASDGR